MEAVFKVKGLKKDDLKSVAEDLGETILTNMNILDIKKLILDNQLTKDDPDFVKELLITAVSERKVKEENAIKIELAEKENAMKIELAKQENETKIELARMQILNQGQFNVQAAHNEDSNSKRKFTLPKLEFRKFGGDIKEWLPFWGQFSNIHNDQDIAAEDKFQYLVQATVVGSRAREVIESYPPTGENYFKAVDSLKTRFGKEDLLIEVYVRELLKLIISVQTKEQPSITYLYDKLESYIRALETLGVTTDKCASILYPMVESCFPQEFLKVWNRNAATNTKTEAKERLDDLMKFLKTEVEGEERINLAMSGFGLVKTRDTKPCKQRVNISTNKIPTASSLLTTSDRKIICIFCENAHKSYECKKAYNMPYEEKKSILLKKNVCFKCFRPNHHSRSCTCTYIKCTKCGARGHNAVMCFGKRDISNVSNEASSGLVNSTVPENNSVLSNQTDEIDVVLQTMNVRVSNNNKELIIRAMIDTGSQRSYATREIIEVMNFTPFKEVKVSHSLFGGKQTEEEVHKGYILNLCNLEKTFKCRIEVLDQKKICNEIARVPYGEWINEIEQMNINISDREDKCRTTDNKIDLLIGADVAGKLLTGKIHSCKTGPVAIHTKLGWTLMGKIPRAQARNENNVLNVTSLFANSLESLWKLDLIGITDAQTDKSEELLREETVAHFQRTVRRDFEGRYEIELPWICERENLENNKHVAEKRLCITSKKLENSGYFNEYGAVFEEWFSKDIIEKAPDIAKDGVYYLPHRAVIKESSKSTKIRPVFDASAKKKGVLSLNDCLEKGPNMVASIPSLLTNFRLRAVAVTADIERAFLQISVCEKDRDFLRFLWYDDKLNIIEYRHKRVVFGVTSSPFLLNITLNHHLENSPEELRHTAQHLKSSFYVDNCITSFDDVEEMEKFIYESRILLSSAQFNLRDWTSNAFSRVLDQTDVETTNLLGLVWTINDDSLSCAVKDFGSEEVLTKRKILSICNSIFDPIGYTSAVMLIPKLILQETWKRKLSWDTELPDDLLKEFKKWLKTLTKLQEIKVPRCIMKTRKRVMQLHVFCDASQKAYATCIFLRYETESQVECSFIQARSRVAPLKKITIPRLELLSCLIGARLAQKVTFDLGYEHLPITFWSDSTNALYWIKRNENWNIFVMNRVQEIRKLTNTDSWKHIRGVENPADLPSRGCSAEKLLQLKWWEGPQWLRKQEEEWPTSDALPNMDVILREKKKTIVVATSTTLTEFSYFSRISSFRKITRIMAWVIRFIKNCKRSNERIFGQLLVSEIENAEIIIWRHVQQESFEDQTFSFQTYLDKDGLLKVKSRISMRKDLDSFKYPIVLPSGHHLVEKLIFEEHVNNYHAGIQVMMTKLRERFWIIKCRKTVRKVLRKCLRCTRFTVTPIEVTEAPLPEDRVREAHIFEVVGVDLCGPMYLKNQTKCWAVLFTCAVYRAVHIELVTFLTTDSFILALRRFIARRGRPLSIYSDNGTNLVGTSNALQLVNWEKIQEIATIKKIQWKFNPPSAPWWGGFWERLIGVLKRILRRVIGNACLDHEELCTVLCEAESLVNSRPLTYVSEDNEDLVVLSPSMFLNDIEETGIADFEEIDAKRLNKRFAYRLNLRAELRKRFRIEYLGQLREHFKIKREQVVNVGDIVLVGDTNAKRQSWPLARILELYPGKDGKVRLAKVKTNSGTYLRPLQRLYPLEVQGFERASFQEINTANTGDKEDYVDKKDSVRTKYGRHVRAPNRLNL